MAPLIPRLNQYLFLAMVILGIPLIKIGINASSNYIDYLTKAQETMILNEQSLNPYLTNIAKSKREKKEIEQAIRNLQDNAIPVSPIMKSIDSFNDDGVALMNITYKSDSNTDTNEIFLTAEINSREATEELVKALEQSDIYKEVISPLSNLVGKEKRLVKVDLIVDKEKVKEIFNNPEDE